MSIVDKILLRKRTLIETVNDGRVNKGGKTKCDKLSYST